MKEGMNWLDIAFLVALVVLIIVGWQTGFTWALVAAGGALAGVFVAGRYQREGAQTLSNVIASDAVATFIAFALVFLATMLVALLIGWAIRRLLKLVFLGWVDNLVGALLGLLVGLALVTVLTLAGCHLPLGVLTRAVDGSAVAQNLTGLARDILPQEFQRVINPGHCATNAPAPL
ncbi:MAG: CvpA family protein [Dehalococcoidia bacterium]|nr:CvpA family protein [Dehalococcoidia bacterium]